MMVSRETVRHALRMIDSEGVSERLRNRLRRRQYRGKGRNFLWHFLRLSNVFLGVTAMILCQAAKASCMASVPRIRGLNPGGVSYKEIVHSGGLITSKI